VVYIPQLTTPDPRSKYINRRASRISGAVTAT